MKVKIYNKHGNVLQKKYEDDVGLDIPMPDYGILKAGVTNVIDSVVHVDIPRGYMGMLKTRTSAAKQGVYIADCPIDAGYTGTITIIATLSGTDSIPYDKGDRFAQLVIVPILVPEYVQQYQDDKRGQSKFGSTGGVANAGS